MPGDLGHVIILTSSTRLVYNMDEWRICGNAELCDFSQVKMETGRS